MAQALGSTSRPRARPSPLVFGGPNPCIPAIPPTRPQLNAATTNRLPTMSDQDHQTPETPRVRVFTSPEQLERESIQEFGRPLKNMPASDNPLEGKMIGPMNVLQFFAGFKFLDRFFSWAKNNGGVAPDPTSGESPASSSKRRLPHNPFQSIRKLSPKLLDGRNTLNDFLLNKKHEKKAKKEQTAALNEFASAVDREGYMSNFTLINTSSLPFSTQEQRVHVVVLTDNELHLSLLLSSNRAEEDDDETDHIDLESLDGLEYPPENPEDDGTAPSNSQSCSPEHGYVQTYPVQLLPDISSIDKRGEFLPTLSKHVEQYHANQELLWINTVVDPFGAYLFDGVMPSPAIHNSHLTEKAGDVIDDQLWLQQAQLRQAATQRDRITVILNEFMTAHSHQPYNTGVTQGLRTHAFAVVLFDPYIRFLRVDWSGVIVSEKVNFRLPPGQGIASSPLEVFLRGFNEMSKGERGWDETVCALKPLSVLSQKVETALEHFCWEDNGEAADKPSKGKGRAFIPPVLEFRVPDVTEVWNDKTQEYDSSHTVYAWYPMKERSFKSKPQVVKGTIMLEALNNRRSPYAPLYHWDRVCLPSRNSLVYPVYDPAEESVFVLKDSWRTIDSPYAISESNILRKLNEAGVRNVPILAYGEDVQSLWNSILVGNGEHIVCHSDSSFHATVCHEVAEDKWNRFVRDWKLGGRIVPADPPSQRKHHRLVESTIGRRLEDCRGLENAQPFVGFIYDALVAHQDAYELCGILHRDISLGNIMSTTDLRHGLLIDWDQARPANYDRVRNEHASGTYQYQSAWILQQPNEIQNTLQDDLESFVYLILVQYLRRMALLPNSPRPRVIDLPHHHDYELYGDEAEAASVRALDLETLQDWFTRFFNPTRQESMDQRSMKFRFCLQDRQWNRENRAVLDLLRQCPPLEEWISEVRVMLSARYSYEMTRIRISSPWNMQKLEANFKGSGLSDHDAMLETLFCALNREDWPVEGQSSDTDDDGMDGEMTDSSVASDESEQEGDEVFLELVGDSMMATDGESEEEDDGNVLGLPDYSGMYEDDSSSGEEEYFDAAEDMLQADYHFMEQLSQFHEKNSRARDEEDDDESEERDYKRPRFVP